MAVMLTINVFGQTGIISGKIYDLQNQQPLQGAIIEIAGEKGRSLSDNSGHFELKTGLQEGVLKIYMLGFKTTSVHFSEKNKHDLNVQIEADVYALSDIRVTAYSGNKTNKETSGSIAVIGKKQINQGSGLSLQPAFNGVAGVRMDQSTLSDSRISIRGMGIRSPWGIRNIKIYVNEIPLTEADGTTRIEGLDVNDIGRVEIIKGPASSIYGGGTGGVINFQLARSPYQENSLELSALGGSYGLNRFATTYRSGGNTLNSYVSYGRQQLDGYRNHSRDLRHFMTANFQIFPSEKQSISLLLNRTSQESEIPGSLTQSQVEEDPKQANAGNLQKNAGRNQTWTRIGIGQEYRFSSKFSNSTSLFSYFYDLDHPLPFAYIRNFYQSVGGRTRFSFNPEFLIMPAKFTIGAEINKAKTKGTQYINENGHAGSLMGNTDYNNTFYSIFFQSEASLSTKTKMAIGLSYTGLTYEVKDLLLEERSGIKKFNPQASPRIAVSHNFGQGLTLHGSISSGFSPPSVSEIKNVDGSVNANLGAERGINYEINAKGNLINSRLTYDLSLFKMDMKGELIGQSIQQGITIYHNSGKTSHTGVELSMALQAIKNEDGHFIKLLRPFAAITYSNFKFIEYKVLDAEGEVKANYDGNELTGIPPWQINAGINMETINGFYMNINYFYSDALPLNDGNTAYNPAFTVINLKAGYEKQLGKRFIINIFSGIDNLTNCKYSSFVSLNAIGYGGQQPAYFNPSPPRNYYGGLNLKYIF